MAASTPAHTSSTFPPAHPSHAARPLKPMVYISHTRQDGDAKTFAASILRPALEAAGLGVCWDLPGVKLGSVKSLQRLVEAAANAMVVVVVLSKSYTQQFLCTLALDLALNSHLQQQEGGEGGSTPLVLPVFYDPPDEIAKHENAAAVQQYWEGKMLAGEGLPGPEWAPVVDAPRWAANVAAMVGHYCQALHRKTGTAAEKDEGMELARRVVQVAVRRIPPRQVDVGVEVVGFEEQEAALATELPWRLGLWLYGQAGRGKSTLAKALFHRLARKFSHRTFVEIQEGDGQEKTAHHVAAALQGLGATGMVAEGASVLSSRLQGLVRDRKVLLVLDNVWSASQLDALLPTAWGEGSTVIVTSRSASFPGSDAWQQVHMRMHQHKVAVLDEGPARQLFRRAAGLEAGLDPSLQGLEEAILGICAGVPLTLQLLGGQLFEDAEEANWQGALAALQQGSPEEGNEGRLKGVLLHSLAGLGGVGVNMFLDAATILRGWGLEEAMDVWAAWHGPTAAESFNELTRRCLLRVDAERMLVVHDVLVALGRGAVLSEAPGLEGHRGSRVWIEGGKVVGHQQGRKVLAANLDSVRSVEEVANWRRISTDLASSPDLSEARVLLGMGACPGDGPGTLTLLRITDLQEAALPDDAFVRLPALRSLSLRGDRLTALPRSVSQLPALQTLDLHGCKSLAALPDLRAGLGALRKLDIRRCTSLVAVPGFHEHPRLQVTYDPHHLPAMVGEDRAWFGAAQVWGRRGVVAVAAPGGWLARWRVRRKDGGVVSIQGVLNDGIPLPPLEAYNSCGVETVVEGEGGCFTEVHGSIGGERVAGVETFMGRRSTRGGWTFKCPPGHRIVGYAGSALRWVERVCFLTAEFRDPAAC